MTFRTAVVSTALCLAVLAGGCGHIPMPSPDRPRGGRLMDDLRVLSADDMEGRLAGSRGSIRARAYILNRFKQEGLRPLPGGWLQTFEFSTRRAPDDVVRGTNIIGWVEGRRHPDQFIVVSAHYDHVGLRDGQIYNGADDNASGVAALFEIARRLRGHAPDHSVIFVAFDAEEAGLKGAEAFVKKPPAPLDQIVFNLNLDMVSRLDKGEIYAVGTYQYPELRSPLEQVAQGAKVTLRFGRDTPQDAERNHWVELSDQEPFYRAGVPFLFFSVDDHADYHEPTDDAERIPVSLFEAAVDLIARSFHAVDTMDLATLKTQSHR
ncbi:MAG: M20/M25/M40 family metallo-hydrolase [Caulobacteraceae bacterium]|nr:M20/M25/M40 family metallo-hydrolase [Caulobacteraceae bacterium]